MFDGVQWSRAVKPASQKTDYWQAGQTANQSGRSPPSLTDVQETPFTLTVRPSQDLMLFYRKTHPFNPKRQSQRAGKRGESKGGKLVHAEW